jgi:HAD superfamily hydrolase (TIGR01549 family)
MMKTVVITDLDNTLFDWVDIWNQCFSAMLDALIARSGLPAALLKQEIRTVHQRHGTSEYAFLLNELPSLQKIAAGQDVTAVFADAIDAFRAARRRSLRLYPTVMETLHLLKQRGCRIIGYTESMAFYTGYRLRKLELDGVIDVLFSPKDHDIPANLTLDQIRKYPAENYEFKHTVHKHTPDGELKPNPHILSTIIESISSRREACVYVGDSLHKDIAMAKDAGVDHAWAKYGIAQNKPAYELLREVTHWSDEAVEYEKRVRERDVQPDHALENNYQEITLIYDFGSTHD